MVKVWPGAPRFAIFETWNSTVPSSFWSNGTSDATVEFDVVQDRTKKTVLHGTQPADMKRAAGQLTLEKTFSANELEPGIYHLKVHVRDQIAKQGVEPEATFAIE